MYRRLVVKDMPRGGVDVFGLQRYLPPSIAAPRGVALLAGALILLGWDSGASWSSIIGCPGKKERPAWSLKRKLGYLSDSVFAFTDLPIQAVAIDRNCRSRDFPLLGLAILVARASGWIAVPDTRPPCWRCFFSAR